MLTQDDLNMIKERAKKATPGPWYADDERWPGNENLQYWFDTHYDGVGAAATKADAEFIAHAREDIPRLVAEVERLREAIKTAERELWWGSPESACVRVGELLEEAIENGD
jgi:hypothetical protein